MEIGKFHEMNISAMVFQIALPLFFLPDSESAVRFNELLFNYRICAACSVESKSESTKVERKNGVVSEDRVGVRTSAKPELVISTASVICPGLSQVPCGMGEVVL